MPGRDHGPSILNSRVYEALRKRRGMSKQRAAAISNAMVSKDSAITSMAIPPTGPHALFNQPGVGIRSARRRRRLKGWDAKVGQTIIGNLLRGEGGRFASAGSSASRKPSARSDRAKQRQARADERRARYAEEDAQEQATRAEEDAYIAAGANGRERQRRRAEIAAKRRERANVRRARRAEDAAMEREQRGEEDAADEQAKNEAKPKGGGGGGGSKKKPTEEEKRAESDRKKAENRAKTAPQVGLSSAEAEFLAGAASGTLPPGSFDASKLRSLGLVVDTGDTTEATDAGRRALAALERGDVRGALAAIQDGKAQVARDAAKRERDQPKKQLPPGAPGQKPGQGSPGQRVPGQRPTPRPPVSTMPVVPSPKAERERNQAFAQRIIRNLEERRRHRRKAITTKAKAKRERTADEEKAMFAAMGGGNKGGGQGRGGGGGASGGKAKEPTLWEKNPKTGKREQAMGLVHENLFGESYRQRQADVQARGAERDRAREAADKKSREQFFALQTGTVQPTAPAPKITPAKSQPVATSSATHGLSKPERYQELENLTERVKMPQPGWNAQASDKQRGYLGSLLERARLNTKEGGETRAVVDAIISANNTGKLTKWEASQLIDAMQKPKPVSTLIDQSIAGARSGHAEAPWRALLAVPGFRTKLINTILSREAQTEGLPF